MNTFLAVCWGASYLAMLANFIVWGWRWSEELQNAQATFFWGCMALVFAVTGDGIARSFRNNPNSNQT
jgi:hypothetical protein